MSLTLPPATLRNAAPQKPVTYRNIRYIAKRKTQLGRADATVDVHAILPMSGANATGNEKTKNKTKDTR
jgi:hypothetical protein